MQIVADTCLDIPSQEKGHSEHATPRYENTLTASSPKLSPASGGDGKALALNLVGALGNLDAYITAVNRQPILTQEEESELARAWREQNDLAAAQKMVLSHLRLVVSIARGYLGYGLPHADLIQEGNIGLMKAVKRFDPAQGVRLVSYAIHWIKAEIHEYILKNWRLVKIATTKAQRKLFFNLRSYKTGFDTLSQHQINDLAQHLDVKREDILEMETRLSGHDIALDSPHDDEDEKFAPIDYLANHTTEPSYVIEKGRLDMLQTTGLQSALDQLDPRSRRIIESRWLMDDEKNSPTLHDLAAEFNVSAERVRQIEMAALKKMRINLTQMYA